MSNCTINLSIGGESISLLVDSLSLPENYLELKNILLEQNLWSSFLNNIRGTLKNRKPIKDIELEELVNSDHLIPNATIQDLKTRYPSVEFPEDTPEFKISNKKVLFVNKYKTKSGTILYGRIINKNGEEIFVVDGSHVQQLAKYFELLQRVISTNLLDLLDSSYLKQLDLIYKEAIKLDKLKIPLELYIQQRKNNNPDIDEKKLQRESLLILFSQAKSPFRNIIYNFSELKDEESKSLGSYSFLDNLAHEILDVLNNKNKYSDRLLQDVVRSIRKYSKDFRQAYLSKDFVFKILPQETKLKFIDSGLVTKSNESSYRKVNEELNKSIKNNKELFQHIFGEDIVNNYDESISGWGILVLEILNRDKTFNYSYKSQEKNVITLLKFSSNLLNVFGIGFEDLKVMNEPEYYKGKYILTLENKDGSKSYYVTDYYTTEFLHADKFDTKEKALDFINTQDLNIVDNSYKYLHALNLSDSGELVSNDKNNLVIPTKKYIPEKTILTILDYDVPSIDINVVPIEMKGFLSSNEETKTKSDFEKFVKDLLGKYLGEDLGFYTTNDIDNILSTINTPEKIFLFISQLNNPKYISETNDSEETIRRPINLQSKEEVLNLVEEIGNVNKYRYYYVLKYNDKILTLIPFKPEIIPEYRKDRKYPLKNVFKAALEVLAPKLGNIKLNILTSEEIENTIKGEYDVLAKAFIKNGEIYVNEDLANPLDLFHEYVHILLGYLKFNEDTRDTYKKLLEEVWNFEKEDPIRDSVMSTYENYSLLDLMEEYFAIKFGNWIKNNTKLDYSNIFENLVIKDGTKLLFDPNNKSKSLKELYGGTLYNVWLNFNSEIALYLEDNKTLDDGEFSNLFTTSRKKTLWIRLQIHDGKLEEYDCI